MLSRTDGSQLSMYKTVAIGIGKSKKNLLDSTKDPSQFVNFTVKPAKSRLGKAGHVTIFEEDDPDLFDALYAVCKTDEKTANGLHPVDLAALKAADSELYNDIMQWPGMEPYTYKFRKGLCYQNDSDGKRQQSPIDHHDIVRDNVNILVQVDYILDNNGAIEKHYVAGMDPDSIGTRLENSRYREAVSSTPQITAPIEEADAVKVKEADEVF